jgi:ABC-type oligopeptide transport system substrate-binding subunit
MLLQQMLNAGRFPEFIDEMWESSQEELMWDFYLHKVEENISFDDFKARAFRPEPVTASKDNLEATVRFSFEMMENFHPE